MPVRVLYVASVVLAVMMAGGAMASVSTGTLYDGTLTATDPTVEPNTGLIGNGAWGWGQNSLSPVVPSLYWKAEEMLGDLGQGDPWEFFWTYTYTLSVPNKQLSHMIVETSENFDPTDDLDGDNIRYQTNDILVMDGWDWGLWDKDSNKDPNMPETIRGIKFDWIEVSIDSNDGTLEPYVYTISFDSDRIPIWGDFYARDGSGLKDPPDPEDEWTTVYNAGFDSDSTLLFNPNIEDEFADIKLLVPDTTGAGGGGPPPVPGLPPTLLLSALPVAGIVLRRFRGR